MLNENGYYNNGNGCYSGGNHQYGGGQPTPPPFPGDRRYAMEGMSNQPRQPWQPMPPQQPVQPTNSIGTAGFVLALISMVIGWLPYMGWLIWLLAVVFSAIGMGKKPRGLAIAGLIISVGLPVLALLALIALGISLATLSAGINSF